MDAQRFAGEILENLHDGVYFVDNQRTIRYWNRAAAEITGFTAEEVVGRSCFDNLLQHVDGAGCSLGAGAGVAPMAAGSGPPGVPTAGALG